MSTDDTLILPKITVTPDDNNGEEKDVFQESVDNYVDGATEFYETYNEKYAEKLNQGIASVRLCCFSTC